MQGGRSPPLSPRPQELGRCVRAGVHVRGAQLTQTALFSPRVWPDQLQKHRSAPRRGLLPCHGRILHPLRLPRTPRDGENPQDVPLPSRRPHRPRWHPPPRRLCDRRRCRLRLALLAMSCARSSKLRMNMMTTPSSFFTGTTSTRQRKHEAAEQRDTQGGTHRGLCPPTAPPAQHVFGRKEFWWGVEDLEGHASLSQLTQIASRLVCCCPRQSFILMYLRAAVKE